MTSAGRVSRLGRRVRGGRSVVVHNFVAAEVIEVPTTTTAFANGMTNSILHSRAIAVDPISGDVTHLYYRNSDLQVVLSRQAGGTGSFVETVATSSIPNAGDDHCSIKAIYDDQGVLCIWLGSHSDSERYYELPVGVTLISEAMRVTPRVPGGASLESAATYHDPVRLNDNAIAVLWRTGGSGNGSNYLDIKRAGVWTRQPIVLDGISDNVSFYANTFGVEEATGRHPNRLYISFQCRPTTDAATAFGLWLIYTDSEGASGSWRKWKSGAVLATGARVSQLAGAEVENIPDAYTDPTFSFYYGLQGMTVTPDGCAVITMYYAPATPPAGSYGFSDYGTATGPATVWAWRCNPDASTVFKRAIRTFGEVNVIGLSRPTAVATDNNIYVFYSKQLSTDPAGSGRMCVVEAVGPSLSAANEQDVFGRNVFIDVKNADFVFDRNEWTRNRRLLWRGMKAGASGTTVSNSPFVAEITILSTAPTLKMPPEFFGSTVLDWVLDPDFASLDGSNNIQSCPDQSGNGSSRDLAQATSGDRPSVVVYDGHNAARCDGSNDFLAITAGLARTAPSTSNKFRLVGIFTMQAWVLGDRMCDVNGALIFQSPSGSGIRINHGTSVLSTTGLNAGLTRKVAALFTASTADQLQLADGAPTTGASAGSTITGTQVVIGAGNGGGLAAQIDVHYMFALRRDWTAFEQYQWNSYAKNRLPTQLV